MSQSTNGVYPTAARLATLCADAALVAELKKLVAAFEIKGTEFQSIGKLGRTQLQDAVPMTLGEEFLAFATTLEEDVKKTPGDQQKLQRNQPWRHCDRDRSECSRRIQ